MFMNDLPDIWGDAADQLRAAACQHQLRAALPSGAPVGVRVERHGRTLWNFSSNNYLDLACHPEVVARACDAAQRFGTGAGGSRLITGTLRLHEELEMRLAALKSSEAALLFSSGYVANIGVIHVLARRADGSRVPIVFDRLVHASLIDAIASTGSPWKSFAHNDLSAAALQLERMVARCPRKAARGPSALIVTEGVFSMDGDVAPLAELSRLAQEHDALLIVDDAHGTGVIGARGEGAAGAAGVAGAPHVIQIGTLSKALGAQGGFVAGPRVLRDLLVNRARTFIYDTALAPPSVGAALAALDVLDREPGRLAALRGNALLLREALAEAGIALPEGSSAIVPVVVGEASRALALAAGLDEHGFLGVAIRPPTVPPGSARIRLTVMATHPPEVIRSLAQALAGLMRG
jgi:8-amino-7-oxononanoate synthase